MILGIVYSTNPDFDPQEKGDEDETLEPTEQQLSITLDTKNRKGKKVTLIDGFVGKSADLKKLAKTLKKKCGVGGSAKEGQIIIQGDQREKVQQILEKQGYSTA
jgi:translation initiation factor 1